MLGTLWVVVFLVAPEKVGQVNLFRTLVSDIWAIDRFWLVILICGVDCWMTFACFVVMDAVPS